SSQAEPRPATTGGRCSRPLRFAILTSWQSRSTLAFLAAHRDQKSLIACEDKAGRPASSADFGALGIYYEHSGLKDCHGCADIDGAGNYPHVAQASKGPE